MKGFAALVGIEGVFRVFQGTVLNKCSFKVRVATWILSHIARREESPQSPAVLELPPPMFLQLTALNPKPLELHPK